MSKPEPRSAATMREMEDLLRPYMNTEAVEILARVMAHIVSRDNLRFPQLTNSFQEAFTAEHNYLLQERNRHRQGQEVSHE
jgi:hypothetical protein